MSVCVCVCFRDEYDITLLGCSYIYFMSILGIFKLDACACIHRNNWTSNTHLQNSENTDKRNQPRIWNGMERFYWHNLCSAWIDHSDFLSVELSDRYLRTFAWIISSSPIFCRQNVLFCERNFNKNCTINRLTTVSI